LDHSKFLEFHADVDIEHFCKVTIYTAMINSFEVMTWPTTTARSYQYMSLTFVSANKENRTWNFRDRFSE